MIENDSNHRTQGSASLPNISRHKDYEISGPLVIQRDKSTSANPDRVVAPHKPAHHAGEELVGKDGKLMGFPILHEALQPEHYSGLLQAPEILTLVDLARREIAGLDYARVMNDLTDLGPDGRLLLQFRDGKLVRHELFEDPRVCKDIPRGAVVHNLEQKPVDVSGWRVHEFYIDSKGCLGEVCSRCNRVCPENAIHLRGSGADSFCEIDQTACKGCFICWVECTRKAADCILIDGKVFVSEMRAAHFGE